MSKFDLNNEQEEMTVTLTLDDNSELECAVISIFPVGDKKYIALLPMTDDEEEEGEVFLYQFNELGEDDAELINIEDDDEFEAVAEAFDELLDEQEFDEVFDEDEE